MDCTRVVASSRVVFIFQLPTTSGFADIPWLMLTAGSGPDVHRSFGEAPGALLDFGGRPAFDLGEVFDQLESVACHAHELLFTFWHTQIGRASAWHPGEVAERSDGFPVLIFGYAQLGEPIGA